MHLRREKSSAMLGAARRRGRNILTSFSLDDSDMTYQVIDAVVNPWTPEAHYLNGQVGGKIFSSAKLKPKMRS